jgi:uncharacterized protein YjiS (DUF1127 family)
MSATIAPRHSFATLHAVTWALDQAIAALRVRHKARRAAEELALMDDRQLADIGLNRGDAYRIGHGLAVDR